MKSSSRMYVLASIFVLLTAIGRMNGMKIEFAQVGLLAWVIFLCCGAVLEELEKRNRRGE